MEVTLTKNQSDALDIAAVEQATTPEILVQEQLNDFLDQMIYKYLLPVGDRLKSLKEEVDRLTIENLSLKEQLKDTPIAP